MMENNCFRNPEIVNYSQRKNPLIRRNMTDVWFIVLWGVILITWIVASIYALTHCAGSVSSSESVFEPTWHHNDNNYSYIHNTVIRPILERERLIFKFFSNPKAIIFAGLSLSLTFTQGFIVFGQNLPYNCCHIGVISLSGALIFCIYKMYERFTTVTMNEMYVRTVVEEISDYIGEILTILHIITALYCTALVGVRHISSVIKDTTRVYFRFPYLIFFAVLIYGSVLSIAKLSLASMKALNYEGFLIYMIFIEGIYLIFFLHFYAVAVVSKIVVSWNWAENRTKVPRTIVLQSLFSVTRYQIGTIAFGATGIGPVCAAINAVATDSNNYSRSRTLLNRIFDKILSVYLILYTTKFSLILNSSECSDFQQCTREALRLLKKNSSKSFAFISVLYGLVIGVLNIVVAIFMITIHILVVDKHTFDELDSEYNYFMTPCTILMLPLFLIVDSTGHTYYLCRMKEDELIDNPNERISAIPLRVMSPTLQTLLE